MPELVLFLSIDGAALGAGPELLSILGQTSVSVVGLGLDDLFVEPEAVHELLAVALRGGDSDAISGLGDGAQPAGGAQSQAVYLRTAGGAPFPHPAHVRACPIYAAGDGTVERLLLTFEVISPHGVSGSRSSIKSCSDEAMVIAAFEASSMVVEEPEASARRPGVLRPCAPLPPPHPFEDGGHTRRALHGTSPLERRRFVPRNCRDPL